ncbi:hypothetical protein F0562_000740 [Nyssa sinensis]|uniref:Agenet domain-containing protein n=1 Tax=Nyssa sinensis TaxID=561372 RepID=A0A5J5C2E7_9ASTE|nr:hypothetical protein F0562_000740 [Nyssa sinensis]
MGVLSEEPQFLDKGSLVEVSTDEEGFGGAWYVATVLDPPPRSASKKKNQHSNRVHVEYQTLLDEDGSKPLRERVNVAFVRPSPPPSEANIAQSFQFNDVVDAFYCDGWWTGVITRVLDNSRFVVTFQNPPDEIEFGLRDLRVHREWVDGKWIEPEKQRTTGLIFSAGKNVEVSFDEEDYRDVWFPAIVLEVFGNDSFLVEYQSPGITSEAGFLKVTVDSLHIRPSPPHLKDKIFCLLEKVDALYNFGWWSGVITKELADHRYIIFFKHTNKEREHSHSELRAHLDWIDGNWVCISQQQSKRQKIGELENHRTVPAKRKGRRSKLLVQSLQPSVGGEEGNAGVNTAEEFVEKECITVIAGGMRGSQAKMLEHFPSEELMRDQKQQFDDPARDKIKEISQLGGGNNQIKRRGRPPKLSVKSPKASAAGKVHNGDVVAADGDVVAADEIVVKDCILSEGELPCVTGEGSTRMGGLLPGKKHLKLIGDNKKLLNGPPRQKNKLSSTKKMPPAKKEKLPNEEVVQASSKQLEKNSSKRGRKRRSAIVNIESPIQGKVHNGDVVTADEIVVKDCIMSEGVLTPVTGEGSTRVGGLLSGKEHLKLIGDNKKLLNGPPRHKNKLSSTKKMPPAKKEKLPNEVVVQASSKQLENNSSKRGRKRKSASVNIESPIQDSRDASRGKAAEVFETDSTRKEVGMAIDELRSSLSDDQPLSMWFEGMHSPTTVDHSRVSPGRAVQQYTVTSVRQEEIAIHPGVNVSNDIVSDYSPRLPFVKTFPLWETIESMEVFQVMPQKPHFRPLDSCKECSREGLAIGSMVNFSGVVKTTSELHFDDPRSIVEDSLDTLLELENHGFDVKVVRDRLTRLLLIKDRQEQLQDQLKELRNWMVEHNHEKTKIHEEIDEIIKQIRELEGKRSLSMLMKGIKESEIASLQARLDTINEEIKNVQLDFEGLAAAKQYPAVDANGEIEPDDCQRLPFVKSFRHVWEAIESMEAFKVMPQKPHFHPLNHCREMFREGFAIGSMVTFASVITKTSELHFDDPRSVIEDSLETLLNLESHGFDVKLLRDRLTGLLLIKDKQEKLQEETKELRNSMEEHNRERTKIHEEIEEMYKQMRELERKRSLATSMKGNKASEITSLQARAGAINEDIKSLQLDFEGVAAAPW